MNRKININENVFQYMEGLGYTHLKLIILLVTKDVGGGTLFSSPRHQLFYLSYAPLLDILEVKSFLV